MDMKLTRKAIWRISLCALGMSAVIYGMINQQNVAFVLGLVFIVIAYLLIRKELKASVHDVQ